MEPPISGVIDDIYLFTYCPAGMTITPKFAYVSHINEYFRRWRSCMLDFEVNPELTTQGNIHYHGFFKLKDKIKWHKSILPRMKRNGFIKINKVNSDFDKAIEYSRKDNEMMSVLMKGLPVPFVLSSIPAIVKLNKQEKDKDKNVLDYFKSASSV